ncbi:TerD family protein [Nioella nitratireducens]|uniref:TerD family protein n=1 Tax=Nioella nitratireducens TaxID=1287720 RepID=UPI0008FD0364|nr:TerD family protein [Nioella nitratireducens]
MSELTPGANAALPSGDLSVLIRHGVIPGAEIDVSAFLVTGTGKVRSDADMCFYGQPSVAGGAVALAGTSGGETRFTVAPGRIPAGVEKVVFTATIHENRAPFSRVPEIGLEVGGISGRIPCAGMTETALILAELYQRNGAWKVRVVGQGFNGGLAKLAPHLGVEVAEPAPAPAPPPPKPTPAPPKAEPAPAPRVEAAPPPKPVSLTKVTLTKSGASSRISLDKSAGGVVRVTATWIDNGDRRSDNDDLDLRAGILMPDGSMHWLAASHPGGLTASPFARHMGDVRSATRDAPGTEIIEVDAGISHKLGGPVGLVFSIYSAISNGPVSIASLKPTMTVEYRGNVIRCEYSFPDGKAAKGVYTYVIATILVDRDELDVKLSGLTSARGSENTPWITRNGSDLNVTFDGAPVFKKGRTMLARMLGAGTRKYANV